MAVKLGLSAKEMPKIRSGTNEIFKTIIRPQLAAEP
jgi:hypothetical protein